MDWDDDERGPLKALSHDVKEPPYKPVYVIIKEMYDEEKELMYKNASSQKKVIKTPLSEITLPIEEEDAGDELSDDGEGPTEGPSEDPSEINEHIDEAIYQKYLYI